MQQKTTEILILGGGLAGVTLAWQLWFRGVKFILIDAQKEKSTLKAAGIFNPVVFKRLTKTYMADECIPALQQFYPKIENIVQSKFFYNLPLYKALINVQGQNNWEAKKGDSNFKDYLGTTTNQHINNLKKYFAWGVVHGAGYINTADYITQSHQFFAQHQQFFSTDDLVQPIFLSNGYQVKIEHEIIEAEKVVFCQGVYALQSDLWKHLTFNCTQGETLTIKSELLKIDGIVKKDFFLLPLGDGYFKVGATYRWDNLDWIPSEEGRNQLIVKLEEMIDCDYTIVNHEAGIRPNTLNRQPFLAEHPEHKNMFVFNGLGSKGVLLAPYLANRMVNLVLGK